MLGELLAHTRSALTLAATEPHDVRRGFLLLFVLILLAVIALTALGVLVALRRARRRKPTQRSETDPTSAWEEAGRRAMPETNPDDERGTPNA